MKKFIVSSLPRTGSEALMHAIANSGLKTCPTEPYYVDHNMVTGKNRYDHIGLANSIFEKYDGFKVIIGHTLQLLEICEKTDAKLILLKRNNYLTSIASYIGLLTGNMGNASDSHETWTSTGKNMEYKPIPFMDHMIDKFLYYNHMIDFVYNQHKNYLTTVHYENPESGIFDLQKYFDREINLHLAPNPDLSKYFVNPEEFKEDVEKRLKKLGQGGLHLI